MIKKKIFLTLLAASIIITAPKLCAGCKTTCTSYSTPFSTVTSCQSRCTSPCRTTPCESPCQSTPRPKPCESPCAAPCSKPCESPCTATCSTPCQTTTTCCSAPALCHTSPCHTPTPRCSTHYSINFCAPAASYCPAPCRTTSCYTTRTPFRTTTTCYTRPTSYYSWSWPLYESPVRSYRYSSAWNRDDTDDDYEEYVSIEPCTNRYSSRNNRHDDYYEPQRSYTRRTYVREYCDCDDDDYDNCDDYCSYIEDYCD